MPAPDNKERNFCFVYKGETIRADAIEKLHGNNAECVFSEEDGNWYARISLLRNFGRRIANIPNIIDEYNKIVAPGRKIELQSSITCYKTTASSSNPIIRKIQAGERTNQTYWSWALKKPRKSDDGKGSSKQISNKRKAKPTANASTLTGLEGLAKQLTLDPTKLDMQGAYAAISCNYRMHQNKELNLAEQISSTDKLFLLNQLSKFFSKEMAYASKPFETHSRHKKSSRTHGTMAALAESNGGSVNDYDFIKNRDQMMHEDIDPLNPSTEPNETICTCLRQLLIRHAETHIPKDEIEISTNGIVCMLNGGGMMSGAYRTTCVPSFLRPFVLEKLIKVKDESIKPPNYVIDIKGLAARLGMEMR